MALSEPLLHPLSTIGAAVLSKKEIYKGHPAFDCISFLIASVVYPFRNATKHFEAIPLALSAAALICLAVVFEGCRSTSSPRDLFFLKVRKYTNP
jgi:hypothetical protein